jgi:uncharacterized protein YndB with AHSA1/START domain
MSSPTPSIITKTITIHASTQKVWQALTIPELLNVWMLDDEISIVSEWKVGMPISIRGALHGLPFENKGMIAIFEPAKTLQYTSLSSLSKLEDKPENYSVLTFDLIGTDNQTALTFTQCNFPGEASYEHSNFYWGTALALLKKLAEK